VATKKLAVEIELSEEEAERFERFMEWGPYDKGKLVKRLIFNAIDRHDTHYRNIDKGIKLWKAKGA
jgi:hypothetical protein